uniref:Uncharacterized protein n=1 Tax=Arundo donax TaxID=35708 RepID=A0A0A9DES2_ARUDO
MSSRRIVIWVARTRFSLPFFSPEEGHADYDSIA